MITVNIDGRLGNQLFQYALGRHLSILHNTDLEIEVAAYPYLKRLFYKKNNIHRTTYQLDVFNINIKANHVLIGKSYLSKVYKRLSNMKYFFGTKMVREKNFHYDSKILKETPGNSYLFGYWQSPDYFSDIESTLRQELTFRDPVLIESQDILKKIQSTASVCLHVRRGDYMQSSLHNVISDAPIYFLKGAKYITNRLHKTPHFFVFSDDPIWSQNNIKLPYPTTFVGQEHAGRKDGNHLQLMNNCKHFIISNSTFAWWAAWLSDHPDKIVVAPKKWLNLEQHDAPTPNLILENWVQL